MTVLPDFLIRELALQHKMIDPFVDHCYDRGTISYGLSSYGYDARLADEFRIFTNLNGQIVDPKCFASSCFVQHKSDHCIIPPNSFALGRTVERFKIPRDCLVICLGKSTYARCGIIVNVTPLEPEWEGYVTLEISNTTPLPAKVYANEGICQFVFLKASDWCDVSYADKKGRYQNQEGIIGPMVIKNDHETISGTASQFVVPLESLSRK